MSNKIVSNNLFIIIGIQLTETNKLCSRWMRPTRCAPPCPCVITKIHRSLLLVMTLLMAHAPTAVEV